MKVTFFLLGSNVETYPQIAQNIYLHGHEIGNHSWSHNRLIFKLPATIKREIETTDKAIRDTGYQDTIILELLMETSLLLSLLYLRA